MGADSQQDVRVTREARDGRGTRVRPAVPRRQLLAAAAAVPALVGTAGPAVATDQGHAAEAATPVPTTDADWTAVARALGRTGEMVRGLQYHVAFPRSDLRVVSHGVAVTPGLALGSHVSFVRYSDGTTMLMGDLVVAESELQRVSDVLQARGIAQTAIHKHLLAQTPDVWWTHVCAHGTDAVAIARDLRAALDRTATPPPRPTPPAEPLDLDTAGIDAALGTKGVSNGEVYTCLFLRRETVTNDGHPLPPGLGATAAFNFQPLGGGRAALNGDLVMVADEVQKALTALRRGGIDLVELHNHGLTDEPRLFFTHVWAVDDAVRLAKALRPAVAATNVKPGP
ncbi:DUF1259 domain-containing protein [Streptomyces sp. NPDC017979]|uniref:DUF1259 domain-containing protein n=1 Tax=Streptomyces sp. NPDC017979 TaxID=3365024 RepID=UPI00379D7908